MKTQEEFIYFPEKKLFGFGKGTRWVMRMGDDFSQFQQFLDTHVGKYVFTCLSYDLKNEMEDLKSENPDMIQFPIVVLWSPDYVVASGNFVQGQETKELRSRYIQMLNSVTEGKPFDQAIEFKNRISRDEYIRSVNQVKEEIQYGNCYELNFCQEFYADNVKELEVNSLFHSIHQQTQAPFSVCMNFEDWSILCFSPERYIKKVGTRLLSQPIKGTIRRGQDEVEDEVLKQRLRGDKKEVSENVMITDLVRNDFARIALKGSVKVEHLCELQTFETLHHLVSSIVCDVDQSLTLGAILRASFPMGSMTGAPKVSVMQLIEKYESFRRGLYSGSVGVIFPDGDFDLNVVIRSLLYHKQKEILSCAVGSAITMKSDPEKEYEECLVKVNKILQFFS